MTPLDYHCKICSKPGIAYYDPECPISNLETWRRALCCSKCYDFRDGYMKGKRAIEALCVTLIAARQVKDKKVRQDAESEIRDRLVRVTKDIVTICSDFYRIQNVWDMEMVDVFMNKPRGCNRSLDTFKSLYAAQSRKQRESIQQEMVEA